MVQYEDASYGTHLERKDFGDPFPRGLPVSRSASVAGFRPSGHLLGTIHQAIGRRRHQIGILNFERAGNENGNEKTFRPARALEIGRFTSCTF